MSNSTIKERKTITILADSSVTMKEVTEDLLKSFNEHEDEKITSFPDLIWSICHKTHTVILAYVGKKFHYLAKVQPKDPHLKTVLALNVPTNKKEFEERLWFIYPSVVLPKSNQITNHYIDFNPSVGQPFLTLMAPKFL